MTPLTTAYPTAAEAGRRPHLHGPTRTCRRTRSPAVSVAESISAPQMVVDLAPERSPTFRTSSRLVSRPVTRRFPRPARAMSFLMNLVGSEHVEAFIPIAEPERERQLEKARPPRRTVRRPRRRSRSLLRRRNRPGGVRKGRQQGAEADQHTTVTSVVKDAARLLSWGLCTGTNRRKRWRASPDG